MKSFTVAASLALSISAASAAESHARNLMTRQVICSSNGGSLLNCALESFEYYSGICLPKNSTGDGFDLSAPCPALLAVAGQCVYGPDGINDIMSAARNPLDLLSSNLTQEDAAYQRSCVCQSQLFDLLHACEGCFEAHGAVSALNQALATSVAITSDISSISSAYCAATFTPTVGAESFLEGLTTSGDIASIYNEILAIPTNAITVSDPIGNKTEVSYYYTPSVTGSAFYLVSSVATGSVTSNSNGQLVATASPASSASGSGSTNAAAATPMALAGGAVLGLAGLVALL